MIHIFIYIQITYIIYIYVLHFHTRNHLAQPRCFGRIPEELQLERLLSARELASI